MRTIGFDNQKYLTTQSEQIKRRIAQFGGKLFDDYRNRSSQPISVMRPHPLYILK